MFEDDRKIFWRAFTAEDRRRKINLKRLAAAIGRAPSTLYKFKDRCAGGADLLELVSREIFGKAWIEVVAEEGADRGKAEDSGTGAGGAKVWVDSDYVRSLEKRIDALQMLVEQHLKSHDGRPSEGLKKTG